MEREAVVCTWSAHMQVTKVFMSHNGFELTGLVRYFPRMHVRVFDKCTPFWQSL